MLRLRPRHVLLAAAPAALILAIGGASAFALRRVAATAAEVRRTEQALRVVENVHASVADIVIDARGFVLTGDSSLLVGQEARRADAMRGLAALDGLVQLDPGLGPRVRAFRSVTATRLALTDSILALPPTTRRRPAPALAEQVRRGSVVMDSLRAELEELERSVERALSERERNDAQVRDLTLVLLVGGGVLAAVVGVGVHLVLSGLLARARAQAADLEKTNARLREQAAELATRRERLEDGALALELANEQLREQATELELQTHQLQEQTVELESANDALREGALRDQLLFERAPLPMWMFDSETLRFLAVNDAAVERYGWSREEFLGRTIRDIRPPADVPMVEALARDHTDGDTTRRAVRHVTKDGRVLQVVVVSHDAVLEGRRVRIVTVEDETARTEAERARVALQRQLLQAQKMEAVGRMASGVAHDFNNLLTAVRVNVENVLESLPAESPFRADLTDADDAISRATSLTRQLLTIGRQQHADRRPADLGVVVRDAERLMRRLVGERVHVELRLAERPLVVLADVARLEQVLVNLAVNARDAMPAGGTLTVATARRLAVPPDGTGGAARAWAVLAVRDTGHGMDADTRERIFEPFFTTKAPGVGTGLGLATAFGIVQQDGGFFVVDSAPGEGARFEVFLPLQHDDAPRPPGAYAGPPPGAARPTPVRAGPA
ncbi:ATP-binding protein, partial [Roseisolibacter sp. H3M3-2]|uniref:ATP-binding protein n=1 Tax=Roseisolibacter sp. H3M3-2 TaxID=3031323 RepID=UPI0023D98FA8